MNPVTPSVEPQADTHQNPADTPLLEVLRHYASEGFDGQFDAHDDGSVRCLTCDHTSPAADCAVGEVRRLEGASDPADMLAVLPITCPSCGTSGTLVVNFGPESTPADAAVLLAVEGPGGTPPASERGGGT